MTNEQEEEVRLQAQTSVPGHDSEEVVGSSEHVYLFPKPTRKPKLKNDTRARKQRSKHQERELARSYRLAGFPKAHRQDLSGSLRDKPGDIDPGDYLLAEAKETRQGRLVLDPEWISKIRIQAKSLSRPWYALHAWVGREIGDYYTVAIVDEKHFFQLIKKENV